MHNKGGSSMKKKNILIVPFVLLSLATIALAKTPLSRVVFGSDDNDADKVFVLDSSNKPTITDGVGVLSVSGATFNYTNASASVSGHVALASGGTITKDIAKGLVSITAIFTGSLSLETGFDGVEYCFSYELTSGVAQGIRGNYLKITADSEADIDSISLTYSCRTEEEESHTWGEWQHDDEKHYRECLDAHCNKYEEAPHTLNDSGIGTASSDTSGTITYSCATCGYSFSEAYTRTGDGKVALGSSWGGTAFDSKLGASVQNYAVVAERSGLTSINGDGAVVYNLRTPQNPGADGTNTGAGFRIMSGYTQTNTSHSYVYTFKNMGSNDINFQVYGRIASSDQSDVDAYDVSLEPGEVTSVNVIFKTQNSNILSYFRFLDNSYLGASLAISLHYYQDAFVNVTLTNAEFTNGSATNVFAPGSALTDIDTELDYIGFSDNLGNINQTNQYAVPNRDVQVTLLTDDNAVDNGTGKLKINYSNKRFLDVYGTNVGFANPSLTYIGDELATILDLKGAGGGSDGTQTNAGFRFRINYNSGTGYRTNLFYTFKNLGTTNLEFDVYQRASGSDTSTPSYQRISIGPNEVATANLYWEANISTNELTYVRFTEGTSYTGQKLAVYAYAEAYPSSYVRTTLADGMTFDDGSSTGYFAPNSTQHINNVPSALKAGQVHYGYYLQESGVVQTSTTLTIPGVSRTIRPLYDVETYYDGTSSLTSTYQKINLNSGDKLHPNAGYSGTFSSSNKPNLGNGAILNEEGQYEYGTTYSYNGAVTGGSHFLNMNAMKSTGSGIDSYFIIKNNGSETIKLNLYCTTSSASPKSTTLATNIEILPGESVEVEKLNHGNAANGNTMVCFEIVDDISSMNFSAVRYVRLH